MMVTGWKTGKANTRTGGGYGIKISKSDRGLYFRPEWKLVCIELDDGKICDIAISKAFWSGCSELRSKSIGNWIINHNLVPWPKGSPPTCVLKPKGGNLFGLFCDTRF